MKSLLAFTKKELMDQLRSGKFIIVGALFILFGIMNPAVAKLTPWLLEIFSSSLSESGITITEVNVTAMDSWVQFFKNIPMALIAFVLLQGSIFTKEFTSGTLVLSLTKGLERYKVILSKTFVLVGFWSLGYWLCFGITYGYNSYFWDNSIAQNLALAVILWWLFGIFTISLMILFSPLSNSNTGVLMGTGGVIFISYLIGIIPKINKYLPTMLTEGYSLIHGNSAPKDYVPAIIITAALTALCFTASIPLFNKKQL